MPLFSLAINDPRNVVALIAFLTTALVINRLIFRMRQSFREVKAAHEQLRLVIDTVPILLASARPDGALEFVNQQWRDFLGLSLEEIQDWGWANALHPDDGLADPEYGRAHTQAIVGATFRVLKGTGHVLQLETPELLVETIWPFVTEGAVLASIQ